MKTTDNQSKTNLLIVGGFLFFYLYQAVYWVPRDIIKGLPIWVYTDWLIDYSSGFVRRGLSGEIISILSPLVSPRVSIGIITWGVFTLVVFGYIRLVVRSIKHFPPYLLTAILFLPSLLPFYLHDHGAFGRKETLGFLFLMLHLHGLESLRRDFQKGDSLKGYLKRLLPITLALLPVQTLVHEGTFLLFVPIHVLISYTVIRFYLKADRLRALLYLIVLYSPVLLVFLIILARQPNFEAALTICKKWELINALDPGSCPIPNKGIKWALPGALSALPWSFSQASALPLSFSGATMLNWAAIFILMSVATVKSGMMTYHLIARANFPDSDPGFINQRKMPLFYKYFLLPLLASMPLYYLGWDWGRWFAATSINFIIVMLSSEINFSEGMLAEPSEVTTKAPIGFNAPPRNPLLHYSVAVFVLLAVIFFIRVPHSKNTGYNIFAEPLARFIQTMVDMF